MAGVSGTTERTATAGMTQRGELLTDGFREVSEYAQNSIEITQGQNGKIGWSVKIYCLPGQELATMDMIWALTEQIKGNYGGM